MEPIDSTYVLDACALIAFFRGETGGETLDNLFSEPRNRFHLHSVTLAEIYYDCLRTSDSPNANDLFEDISGLPIKIAWNLTPELIARVGHFKTTQRVSFADCFVLSLAEMENATVISTDHHEFDVIEQKNVLRFFWLR
ncbi:MAG: PIN domain-containing protein [Desulfococcaceae bacterium]